VITCRRGADVIHEGIKHARLGTLSEEELKLMLSLVRPRYFVPVHGEYCQLAQHARIAEGVAGRDPHPETLLIENGDILQLTSDSAKVAGKAPAGRVLIDGTRTGEVGGEVLRDRRHLAEDGLVVPVVAINKQTGMLEGVPDIITRGVVMENSQEFLAEGARVLSEVMEQSSLEERTDPGLIRKAARGAAAVLSQALRPPAICAPRHHGDLTCEWIRFQRVATRERVRRRRAVRRLAHLDRVARELRAGRPRVVLQHRGARRAAQLRRPRRRVPRRAVVPAVRLRVVSHPARDGRRRLEPLLVPSRRRSGHESTGATLPSAASARF
jgi:hypothetical protein